MANDMLFGLHPLLEALESGENFDKVLLQTTLNGNSKKELTDKLKQRNIPIQYVPFQNLNRVCKNRNHQGVVAFISQIEYHELDMLLPTIYERGETPLLLLLDGLTDIRNFGAVARSAECMGVHSIIIPHRGSVRVSADAIKTSAGALLHLPVCRVENSIDTAHYLTNSGIELIAMQENTTSIASATLTDPLCLILGAEGTGISDEMMKLCNRRISIPMTGRVRSLNVSVAAGIALYEISRQRILTTS